MRGIRTRHLLAGLLVGACGGAAPATVAVAPPPAPPVAVEPPPAIPAEPMAAPADPTENPAQVEAPPPDTPAPADARRGWLGVELEPAPDLGGVRINNIVPHSPAEGGGLVSGDVILKIDGDAVTSPSNVVEAVQRRPPGTQVGSEPRRMPTSSPE